MLASFATALLGGALALGCGSRTALGVDPESCLEAGVSRACENACGTGTQTCVGNHWTACEVPVAVRACTNLCGDGSQTCERGAWSDCNVPPVTRVCMTRCGQGREVCTGGVLQACDAPQPVPPRWTATVRDFSDAHPDFENGAIGFDPGIVAPDLGPDDKPVYAGNPTTPTTTGKSSFDEWYRDVSVPNGGLPVNASAVIPFPLLPSPADPTSYQFVRDSFFPIDEGSPPGDMLLGNQGRPHDFDFTLEVNGQFLYTGGETFRFASDDDLWVFLNRKLAIDDGGIHARMSATVELDANANALGIVRGGVYSFHLFFAERLVSNSALEMIVPAADFSVCP